jgi:hypothetical protein
MKPGFLYCPRCGRAEPNGWDSGKFQQGGHPRPNPDHHPDGASCNGRPTVIVLGNEFDTDIALFRFHLGESATIPPGSTAAKILLTTVAEALAAAAAKVLDIEASDIGAEFRVAMTSGGRTGHDVEVYLYDLTPGGAGFVRAAVADPSQLFDTALERLESCDCTHSCYQCLRSYKNKWDHTYLDRKLGAAFIRHAVLGERPTIADADEDRLLRALQVDLEEAGHQVTALGGGLELPALKRTVVLGHCMTPRQAGSTRGRGLVGKATQHIVIDQLLVDRALPAAMKAATGALVTTSAGFALPDFLATADDGCPIFDPNTLGLADPATPLARVVVKGAPDGAFVVKLSRPTLERMGKGEFGLDAWVVFAPASPNDFAVGKDKLARLLVRKDGAFNATKERWTFGLPSVRGDKLHVLYFSHVAPRSETPRVDEVVVVGRAFGVFVGGQLQLLGGA